MKKIFKCEEQDGCVKSKPTTCETTTSCFTVTRRVKKSTSCQIFGCFDEQLFDLYCGNRYNKTISNNQTTIWCCNHKDFCNQSSSNFTFDLRAYPMYSVLSLLIITIIYLINKRRKFRKTFRKTHQPDELSIVIEKSFYKQITLLEHIGEGRYGKVYKGLYYDQIVAVKTFTSNDYDSYKRELDVYKIHSLSRESILKCIGYDTALIDFSTEYWLVLAFCKLGSLYDYLQTNVLERDQFLCIVRSMVSGLNHLHDAQEFTLSKPAIAHRDLKSKNLLMKTDRTVCIADFGLCVTSNDLHTKEPIKIQVGTKRYFAPELLDETLDNRQFDSFAFADIYSLSLVMWETLNQSELNSKSGVYHLPYYEYTNTDPSIGEMTKIVIVDNRRPMLFDLDDDCFENQENHNIPYDLLTYEMCKIIRTCWDRNPSNRLTALQVKQRLDDLYLLTKKNRKN